MGCFFCGCIRPGVVLRATPFSIAIGAFLPLTCMEGFEAERHRDSGEANANQSVLRMEQRRCRRGRYFPITR